MRYLMAVLFILAAAGTPEQCSQGEPDASVIIYPYPDASVIIPHDWCEWDGGWRSDCRERLPDPRYRDGGFPGSGIGSDPGTGILILIRVDPGTANLAMSHARLVDVVANSVVAEGLKVRAAAVASMQDGQLLWAGGYGIYPPMEVHQALDDWAGTAYAAAPALTCTSLGLEQTGHSLAWADVSYPSGGTWGVWPFSTMPTAMLIVFVDTEERPADVSGAACSLYGYDPVQVLSMDPQLWLGDGSLPRAQVRYFALHTQEQVSAEAVRTSCLSYGMPLTTLDFLQPSPVPFFGNLSARMSQYPDLLTPLEYCSAMQGTNLDQAVRELTRRWVVVLKASATRP